MALFAIKRRRRQPIPQHLLVVRGARHHAEQIRSLLYRELPIPLEAAAPGPTAGGLLEHRLKHDCIAQLVPEPNNAFDPDAVAVMVEGKRVGYIARNHARAVKALVEPDMTFECTIFWNGDSDDGFQFFTIQLFS